MATIFLNAYYVHYIQNINLLCKQNEAVPFAISLYGDYTASIVMFLFDWGEECKVFIGFY